LKRGTQLKAQGTVHPMCPAVPGPRVNAWGWACPATRQTGLLGRTRPSTVIYTIYTMAAASQASAEPAPHAGRGGRRGTEIGWLSNERMEGEGARVY
jgi:hypothetical protein